MASVVHRYLGCPSGGRRVRRLPGLPGADGRQGGEVGLFLSHHGQLLLLHLEDDIPAKQRKSFKNSWETQRATRSWSRARSGPTSLAFCLRRSCSGSSWRARDCRPENTVNVWFRVHWRAEYILQAIYTPIRWIHI